MEWQVYNFTGCEAMDMVSISVQSLGLSEVSVVRMPGPLLGLQEFEMMNGVGFLSDHHFVGHYNFLILINKTMKWLRMICFFFDIDDAFLLRT